LDNEIKLHCKLKWKRVSDFHFCFAPPVFIPLLDLSYAGVAGQGGNARSACLCGGLCMKLIGVVLSGLKEMREICCSGDCCAAENIWKMF